MLTKKTWILFGIPVLIGLIITTCKPQGTDPTDVIPGLNATGKNKSTSDTFVAAKEGSMQVITLQNTQKITCPGYIDVPPNSKTLITVPYEGLISKILIVPGQFVNKDNPVAILSNPEYIQMQEEFLVAKSELEYYREEFKRQGQLTIEKAAPIKKMQEAEANYLSREARFLSLKKQLQLLNIPTDSISVEKILSNITVNAPISGYITNLNAQPGKLIRPGDAIAELYNTHHMYLHLQVPQKHIHRIAENTRINFVFAADTSTSYTCTITTVANIVDKTTGKISAFATIDQTILELKPNLQVEAILGETQQSTYLVPTTAILEDQSEKFLLVKSANDKIEKLKIKTKPYNSDYSEILKPSELLLNHPVLVNPASNKD